MSTEPAVDASADTPPHRYTAALANQIETRWQDRWQTEGTFHAPNPSGPMAEPRTGPGGVDLINRPKMYVLDMFPYPSGAGLHVGHPLGYIATDVLTRFQRMNERPQRAVHDGLRCFRPAG